MIAYQKTYKFPVEISFSVATAFYFRRLLILVGVAAQVWVIMWLLTVSAVFSRSYPMTATAVIFGFSVIGVFIVNLRVYKKFRVRRLRTAEDVEKELDLATLAIIPRVSPRRLSGGRIHLLGDPRSPQAEAYRHLRTSLMLSSESAPRSILFTSPLGGEGTTSAVVNIGELFAQTGKDVLLIDCNLRRPRLHSIFGVSNNVGLTNILAGLTRLPFSGSPEVSSIQPGAEESWRSELPQLAVSDVERPGGLTGRQAFQVNNDSRSSEIVVQPVDQLPNLWLMPAGPLPPNPAELIGSETMGQVLASAAKVYNHIILDSPPLLFTDAALLARMVDASVLVANADETPVTEAQRAKRTLEETGAKIVGVVLNGSIGDIESHYYNYYDRAASEDVPVEKPAVIDL